MHFALSSAAVHFCGVTAPLYEEQVSIGVIAVTQACCEAVLQSSTKQQSVHFTLSSAAVHFCGVTAPLYKEQASIGVIADTQACCEAVLQSSF